MYPLLRSAIELVQHRSAPPLATFETHVSRHTVLPWDLDPWLELNNGRTLTLYDLGRIVLVKRLGMVGIMSREGWGMSVAGASVRYRRRLRVFQQVELRSRLIGWDARFLYLEQAMWRRGACCSQALLRMAVTDDAGIVTTDRVAAAIGHDPAPPPLPGWVTAWIDAEAERPWPPLDAAPGTG